MTEIARKSPPAAEQRPVSTTLHGHARVDNYAWLRDENWQQVLRDPSLLAPDIRAYLEAENTYAEDWLARIEPLTETLFAEMRGRIREDDSSVPAPDGSWAYYQRFEEGGEYPLICRLSVAEAYTAAPETGEVVLDGPALAEGEAFFHLGSVEHAPDHRLLAYTVDTKGAEFFTLRFAAIGAGEAPTEEIPNVGPGFEFDAAGRSVLYVELDENHRSRWVKRHLLGTDPADDVLVYEEPDPGFFLSVSRSESREMVFIRSGDHTTTEYRYLPADDFSASPIVVAAREPGVEYEVTHWRGDFILSTNHGGAVDFKLLRAPAGPVDLAAAKTWLPHRPGVLLLDVAATADYLVVLEREDALPRLVIHGVTGSREDIAFAEEAYDLSLLSGPEYAADTVRYAYSSPAAPRRVCDHDMRAGTVTVRKEQEVPSGHDPARYAVRRLMLPARDGAEVPVTLLYRPDLVGKAPAPLYLYGYGAYGISMPASFVTTRLSLADRGIVCATAHIRGGKEKGYGWYLDGKAENKVNTFTDFIDVAQGLVADGWTTPGRIAIHGGSAGGLLMGAVVNMAPEGLFAAAVADVPFVDTLTTMCDETLPLTPPEWPEWGNPLEDPAAYQRILSYSPYDNVTARAYPALLVLAGLTDPRVTYWEPAKWVACLRKVATGDHPVLLKTNMDAGHGGASGRFSRLRETALSYAFLCHLLGKGVPESR